MKLLKNPIGKLPKGSEILDVYNLIDLKEYYHFAIPFKGKSDEDIILSLTMQQLSEGVYIMDIQDYTDGHFTGISSVKVYNLMFEGGMVHTKFLTKFLATDNESTI